jgi:hypothetical protein
MPFVVIPDLIVVYLFQPALYRMYQFFERADIAELLRSFVSDASCLSSPSVFSKVVGGRLDMNANVMRVGGKADGS